jgi:hypothetical protein
MPMGEALRVIQGDVVREIDEPEFGDGDGDEPLEDDFIWIGLDPNECGDVLRVGRDVYELPFEVSDGSLSLDETRRNLSLFLAGILAEKGGYE